MTGNNDPTLAPSSATEANAAAMGANRDPGPTCDLNAPSLAEEVVSLLDGYLADLKAGRSPDREKLLRDHPHLAGQLEACLAGLEFIHRVKGTADGSTPVRLGDFRILREVGRGGMGAVYEATQLSLGRRVALKVIRFGPVSDPQAITRFQREAETVARLHHTNIVPIYTVGCEGGVNYYAMEFIDGRCLSDVLKQGERPIDPRTIAAWGLQAAEALAHAHQRGVIHRDVKPSNLLLDAEDRIWLTDFGLARRQDDVTLSMTGALLGTPRYMSPEQAGAAHQRIDHRTDIYSLGATLYELAVGRPPFTADTHHAVISQILSAEPPAPRTLRADLPRDLETIIVKCLAKEAPQRYASAAELADDLRAFHEGRAIRARRASLPERAVRWVRQQRRSMGLSAAAAAATLLIAITAVASMYGYQRWQTAYLQLATNHPPLVAEVLSSDDAAPLATQTVPTQTPIELPAGDYRLRVTGDGRMSQEYQVALGRQSRTEQRIDLEDQLLTPTLDLPRSFAVVDFPDGADVLAFDETGIHRHDGANSFRRWTCRLAEPTDPIAQGVVGLHWPWDKGVGTMQGGHDKFDSRPWFLSPAVDLNADGEGDIIVAARHQAWIAVISGGNGTLLWLADRRSAEQRELDKNAWGGRDATEVLHRPLAVNDLDGDGMHDLVAVMGVLSADSATATRWVEAISGRSGSTIWRHDLPAELFNLPAGTVIPYAFRWFVAGPSGSGSSGGYGGSGGTFAKRHGRPIMERHGNYFHMPDAPREVSIEGQRRIVMAVAGHVIGLNAADGAPFFDDATGLTPGQAAVWGDVDGDGALDLALLEDRCDLKVGPPVLSVRMALWSAAKRALLWQKDLNVDWPARPDWAIPAPEWPQLVDLNGDDRAEVLAPSASSESLPFAQSYNSPPWGDLTAFDGADGRPLWTARIRSLDQQADYFTVGPDIDGDRWREVFAAALWVPSLWREQTFLYVNALAGGDGRVLWWNRQSLTPENEFNSNLHLVPLRWQSNGPGALPCLLAPAMQGDFSQSRPTVCRIEPADGHVSGVGRDCLLDQAADADGDGIDDLFVFHPATTSQGGRLDVLRGAPHDGWRRLGPALTPAADFDGDGLVDLVETPTDGQGRVRACSGATGSLLWDKPHDLGPHSNCRATTGGPVWQEAAPAVARPKAGANDRRQETPPTIGADRPPPTDLDRDGTPDLLVYPTDISGNLPALAAISGRDGRRLWTAGFNTRNTAGVLAARMTHLDADDLPDVVFVVAMRIAEDDPAASQARSNEHRLWAIVLSGRDGRVRWRQPLGQDWALQAGGTFCPYRVSSAPDMLAIADWNADGTRDLLVLAEATPDGAQFEWRALSGVDGQMLWQHIMPRGNYAYDALINTPPPAVGDLDGDGRPEAIVLEFQDDMPDGNWRRTARVRAIGADGQPRWAWELPVDYECGRVGASSDKADYRPRPLLLRAADGRRHVALMLTTVIAGAEWPNQRVNAIVLDHTGQVALRREYTVNERTFRIAGADLDGDAIDELLISSGGEVTVLDPAAADAPRWQYRAPNTGDAVEFQGVLPAAGEQPATIIVRRPLGDNSMLGLDGGTGRPRWVCPGPVPRQDNANIQLDAVAFLGMSAEVAPRAFYRFGSRSIARPAAFVASDKPTAAPAPAMPQRGHDPRYLRPLPWPTMVFDSDQAWQLVSMNLWGVAYCVTLIVLPAGLLWRMIVRRRWGLWTMLALPAVAAVAIAVLLAPGHAPQPVYQKYLTGLAAFPVLLFLWLLVRWTMQRRWTRLAVWAGLWIVLTLAAGIVSYQVAIDRGGPLEAGDQYSWDGWYMILLIGAFMTTLATVILLPVEAAIRAAWKRLAGKRRVAVAV